MRIEDHRIEVEPGVEVSSVWALPEGFAEASTPVIILAHGAGSDMRNPLLSFVHEALATRGFATVKFNFPYREAARKLPDPTPRLARTWRSVIERVRAEMRPGALVVGGHSMGGRIASMLVARDEPVAGLALLGYPLQPAGRPDVLRWEHLAHIRCPILFVQGSRDRLCDLGLLRGVLTKLCAPTTLHVIDDADHSFKVPKRSGKTQRQVWGDLVDAVESWLAQATRDRAATGRPGSAG